VIAFVLKSPKAEVHKRYEVLSEPERQRLVDAAQAPREQALVFLALGAGLRVSELVNSRLKDFSQDEADGWWVLVKMGKGRKDRLIPVAPSVMGAVRSWVEASGRGLRRRSDRDTYLFSTRQSPRMTTARAWQLVKGLAKEAGLEKPISPHSLRHTMAIETLRAGAGPVIVQKLLGHASLSTTQRYVDHLERADLGQWAFSPA
jgi:integrase/recombinase XerD